MKKLVSVGLLVLCVCVSGCATSFTGSAKVDGPKDCRTVCDGWGMDLAGMVAMGEYTNGCICRVKGEQLSMKAIGSSLMSSAAGASGGSAAVYMQNQD